MAIVDVTDKSFATEVESQGAGTVLVDFWAPWCGPCQMQSPILDQVATELGNEVKIAKMNVDNNQEVPGRFGVMSIPTLMVFKEGKMVSKMVGLQPKEHLLSVLGGQR